MKFYKKKDSPMIKKIVTLITLLICSSTITPSSLLRYCCGLNNSRLYQIHPAVETYRSVTPTPSRGNAVIRPQHSDSLDSNDRHDDSCFQDLSCKNSGNSIQYVQLEGLYERVLSEKPMHEGVIDLGNGVFKLPKKK